MSSKKKKKGDQAKSGRATFTMTSGPKKGTSFEVHFNPETLDYTITNTISQKGKGKKKKQFLSKSTGKLAMDLIFDTTHSGEDVRSHTNKVAKLMEPAKKSKTPPTTKFEWGAYAFEGMIESYKETIDFFSKDGVPLRAQVKLSLAAHEKEDLYTAETNKKGADVWPKEVAPIPGADYTKMATKGGNPNAGRRLAEQNNADSVRKADKETITVEEKCKPKKPPAFSNAPGSSSAPAPAPDEGGGGAGAGGAPGGGFGGAASAGAAASASASASASAGGGPRFGGRASAGVSASAGAFAGLRTKIDAGGSLDADLMLGARGDVGLSARGGASVALGGRARCVAGGLETNVGGSASLASRLRFDEG